jgi:hypothetical protein
LWIFVNAAHSKIMQQKVNNLPLAAWPLLIKCGISQIPQSSTLNQD